MENVCMKLIMMFVTTRYFIVFFVCLFTSIYEFENNSDCGISYIKL